MAKPKILVIDDDAGIRESLKMTLEYDGYDVIGAATGPEGRNLVERDAPDLVLLDVKMPGMDGFDVMSRLRSMQAGLPMV
jgi:DNA-binding response OmpR family regulator